MSLPFATRFGRMPSRLTSKKPVKTGVVVSRFRPRSDDPDTVPAQPLATRAFTAQCLGRCRRRRNRMEFVPVAFELCTSLGLARGLPRGRCPLLEAAELLERFRPSIRLKHSGGRFWMGRFHRHCLGRLRRHCLGQLHWHCLGRLHRHRWGRCPLASECRPLFDCRAARTPPRMMLVTRNKHRGVLDHLNQAHLCAARQAQHCTTTHLNEKISGRVFALPGA